MSSHATLSAASDDRKARLAKLKSLKRKQPTEPDADADADEAETETTLPQDNNLPAPTPPTKDIARLHLSGRNYDFSTKGPKLGFEAPPTLELAQPTLEQQAQDLEDESKRQAAVDAQTDKGIDLFKLQPKKPNWDLKRELNLRMEGLQVRTENAIARLVRERLAEKKAAAADAAGAARGGREEDAEAEGVLDGAELVEGMRLREREEEEENRREREAEAEEFGMP
ncbi:cwf18 pre-mRNA splicing factor-domain-containing protein [Parachaetomium inaequale]|uniref:Cwf18 pre-mRNA splicing factor-domain-containing protein n=1 Tax=Parachaetomium inaequale TaxID=2588326 RepID=A0AAN6P7Y9_9PEZI|nr:cwf18 pre-mRNA splicing factor-domain-containing protein [Parachaetomium inaequale]